MANPYFFLNKQKIYLVAGELSGDTHGADLIHELLLRNDEVEIRFMGGDLMSAAGGKLAFHYKDFAIMGFVEVLRSLKKISAFLRAVQKDIENFNPDQVIFIDFPGFNLRLAKRLPSFSLHYYIAPKAWAWNKKRVHVLAKHFKTVNCILPFEADFFKSFGVNAKYVGNPSMNQVQSYISTHEPNGEEYIALFPGSRRQEVERVLPVMLKSIKSFQDKKYKISKASSLDSEVYLPFIESESQLYTDNYELLHGAKAALVTSGTATLETALFNVPQVVCYIANPTSYWIAKRLVSLKYISLVNLIANSEIVTELIQKECNSTRIRQELQHILTDKGRKTMLDGYGKMKEKLLEINSAQNTIDHILTFSS